MATAVRIKPTQYVYHGEIIDGNREIDAPMGRRGAELVVGYKNHLYREYCIVPWRAEDDDPNGYLVQYHDLDGKLPDAEAKIGSGFATIPITCDSAHFYSGDYRPGRFTGQHDFCAQGQCYPHGLAKHLTTSPRMMVSEFDHYDPLLVTQAIKKHRAQHGGQLPVNSAHISGSKPCTLATFGKVSLLIIDDEKTNHLTLVKLWVGKRLVHDMAFTCHPLASDWYGGFYFDDDTITLIEATGNFKLALVKGIIEIISRNTDDNDSKMGPGGFAREAFPNWTSEKRIAGIIQDMQRSPLRTASVVMFQELRNYKLPDGTLHDVVTPAVAGLQGHGYEVVTAPYNTTTKSFHYLTAWNPRVFKLVDTFSYYLTKTPDAPTPAVQADDKDLSATSFGEKTERSVFVTRLEYIATHRVIAFINVHIGMSKTNRFAASKMLPEMINAKHLEHFVMAGDFNSFDDDEGQAQIAILREQLTEIDTCAKSSFVAYPYDFVPVKPMPLPKPKAFADIIDFYTKNCRAIGSVLDHVFVSKGLAANAPTAAIVFMPTPNEHKYIPAPTSFDENAMREFVIAKANVGEPASWSDHQPLIIRMKP